MSFIYRALALSDLRAAKGVEPQVEGTAACLQGLKNIDKLENPHNLQPLTLPISLSAFQRIPVVISAGSDAPGKPLHLISVLYIDIQKPIPGSKVSVMTRKDRQRQNTDVVAPPFTSEQA